MFFFLNDYRKIFLFLIFLGVLLLSIFFFTFLLILALPIIITLFFLKKYLLKKSNYEFDNQNIYDIKKNENNFIDVEYKKDEEKEL